jgi:two-component system OmpR family sensor kinase
VGRLFWKFFVFSWLAQLAGVLEPRFERAFAEVDAGPGAATRVAAAAAIFRYGGVAGFKEWALAEPGPPVFAVDQSGVELLGREVALDLLTQVRRIRPSTDERSPVREIVDPNGKTYLLFAAGHAPPPGPRPEPRGAPRAGIIGVTLLASVAIAWGLAWYVAKPIRGLRGAFNAVAAGDLATRVAPLIGSRHDELADLGHDFDRMADQLEASMRGQRRLLHDVSHEMRSPLARLQAATGLLRLKYGPGEPTVERIDEEIVRMDKLVGDLLKLSRLEAGELNEPEEPVDMQQLVREIVDDANFEAHLAGRSVVWTDETAATVLGRPEMLHGAIENVVRNALKHAAGNTDVRVHTSVDIHRARYSLRVLDSGPGVPSHELGGLFTPFFRAADAQRTEGYGLGLAIARRSIEAHGGTIRARNRPEGGLAVDIELPLSDMAAIPA